MTVTRRFDARTRAAGWPKEKRLDALHAAHCAGQLAYDRIIESYGGLDRISDSSYAFVDAEAQRAKDAAYDQYLSDVTPEPTNASR